MAKTDSKKCAHPPCQCVVEGSGKYCSTFCSDAGSSEVEIACDCGHSACAEEARG